MKNLFSIIFAFGLLFNSTISFAGTVQLPQTGQASCHDASGTIIACTGTGQDGELRAGVVWPTPRFTDKEDQTVQDNLTGLIWAKDGNLIKTRDPGFDNDSTAGNGAVTWQHALDYINKLNQESYLGHSDWRLPNVIELESLIHVGVLKSTDWLKLQGFSNVQAGRYWSSSTNVGLTNYAWVVNIYDGDVNGYAPNGSKSGYYVYVWPVRSRGLESSVISLPKTGQSTCYNTDGGMITCAGTGQDGELQMGTTWPVTRFANNGNQTATDNLTGLIWPNDAKTTGPAACGPGSTKTWQGSLDYVKCLNTNNYMGYNDWRLPNRKELWSLFNYGQSDSAVWLALQGFSNVQTNPASYWSSSSISIMAWLANMWNGVNGNTKSTLYYVWPVRSVKRVPLEYTTIQAAIDAAITGDTVLVSPGTYVENIDFKGKNITVGSLFLTTDDPTYIGQTIIDGGAWDVAVSIKNGEGSTAKLIGLSITNGIRGIVIQNASPTIQSCAIYKNSVPGDNGGGGIWALNSLSIIQNCTIYENYARSGGGIRLENFTGMVTDCNISNNRNFDGAGSQVSFVSGSGKLQNSRILEAGINGYSLIDFTYGAAATLENIFIQSDNHSNDSGVFSSWAVSRPSIINATIINTSGIAGILLSSSNPTFFAITNSIASGYILTPGTGITARYSRFDNAVTGTGNISTNPLFLDPTHNNYHLSAGSPCIDSGTATGMPTKDLDGIARPQGIGFDMGAYEYNSVLTLYPLTVNKAGTGSGTVNSYPTGIGCGPSCNATFANGLKFTFIATPDVGSIFLGWSGGGCSGTQPTCQVTMDGEKTITAIFTILDSTAPLVSGINASSPTNSLSIPVTITASDNVGVTAYLVTNSSSQPAATVSGWNTANPSIYNVTSSGTYTLYGWAKDTAGNVSTQYSPIIVTVDRTTPTTTGTIPAANTTSFTGNIITVSFSEAMDSSTINNFTFTVKSGTTAVTGNVSYNTTTKTATFTSSSPLSYNVSYTVTLTTGIKDAAGNALGSTLTWGFTTLSLPHTVTSGSNSGGLITPEGSQSIQHNNFTTFTITPAPGYMTVGVMGSCGGSLNGKIYTSEAVEADCTVGALFAKADITFDENSYLAANPDVATAVRDGWLKSGWDHYVKYGSKEGRPLSHTYYSAFDESYYLRQSPDVASAVRDGWLKSGWLHYAKYGLKEGRRARFIRFNEDAYLTHNPDVAAAVKSGSFISGWQHYSLFGLMEGRLAMPANYNNFSEDAYLAANPDVATVVRTGYFSYGWEHYVKWGKNEGRALSPTNYGTFNDNAYMAAHPDVAAVVTSGYFSNGWTHYVLYGEREGRSTSPPGYVIYRDSAYLAANLDVAAKVKSGLYSSGWDHYAQFGVQEGRPLTPAGYGLFDEYAYLAANPDVAAAVKGGSSIYSSGWVHYVRDGKSQGRALNPRDYGAFNEGDYLAANPDVYKAVLMGDFPKSTNNIL